MSLISYSSVSEIYSGVSQKGEATAKLGYPVVLTADRTLMADYDLLFDGMLAASQTTSIPPFLVSSLLMLKPRCMGNRCTVAPLGLRRIESALLSSSFTSSDVIAADYNHLSQVIGPSTRIVGVSSGEPCGMGMNTSTMTAVAGGRIYPEEYLLRHIRKIRQIRKKHNLSFKLVLGGPGAWQLASSPEKAEQFGIDHVITGYCEGNIDSLFSLICKGQDLPLILEGTPPSVTAIPPIKGASTMGVVEISRGCGFGCTFCALSDVKMMHLPISIIKSDIKTNIANGINNAAILSEDFFRYGSSSGKCNPSAVLELVEELRNIEGLGLIQLDHCNISSVAQLTDSELSSIRSIITRGVRHEKLWVNVGVETPCGELLRKMGGTGKMAKVESDEWGAYCAEQLRRLCAAGYMPMVSLIIGLPGEEPSHIAQTIEWVRSISNEKITVFPVLYAPVDGSEPPDSRSLSKAHWDLISKCYDLNFRWIPAMYWDNQTGAGVALWKRLLMQIMGKGQVIQWKTLISIGRSRSPR